MEEGGKTPTTPTISSIIAGMQCQEAIKLLHGLPTIAGRGWVVDGLSADSYLVEYQRKDECYSHDTLDEVIALDEGASTVSVGELLHEARRRLGPKAELELGRDVLEKLVCPRCGGEEALFASLGKVRAERALCPRCPDVRRDVRTFYKIRGNEAFLDCTPAEIGVPPFDILIARAGSRAIGLELAGDADAVLGPVAGERAVR